MVKSFIKSRKKKLWAEMLVNMEDMVNDVKRYVNGVTLRNEPFATGIVHAINWLLNCCWFYQYIISVQIYTE